MEFQGQQNDQGNEEESTSESSMEKVLRNDVIQRCLLKCFPLADLKIIRLLNKEWNHLTSSTIFKRKPFPLRPLQFLYDSSSLEYFFVFESEIKNSEEASTSTSKSMSKSKSMSVSSLSGTIENSQCNYFPRWFTTLVLIRGKLKSEKSGITEFLENHGENVETLILSQISPIPFDFTKILVSHCPNLKKLSLDLNNSNNQCDYSIFHFSCLPLPSLEWFHIGLVDELFYFPLCVLKHAPNLKRIAFSRDWKQATLENWLPLQFFHLIKEFHYSPGENSSTLQFLSRVKENQVKLFIFSVMKSENPNPNPGPDADADPVPEILGNNHNDVRAIGKILKQSVDSLRVLYWTGDFGINSSAQIDFFYRLEFNRMEKLELTVASSEDLKFDGGKIKSHFPKLKCLSLKFEPKKSESQWQAYFDLPNSYILTFDLVDELQVGGMPFPQDWWPKFQILCPNVKKLWIFQDATSTKEFYDLGFVTTVKQLDRIFLLWPTLGVVQFGGNIADIRIKRAEFLGNKTHFLKIIEQGLEKISFDPNRGDLQSPVDEPEIFTL